MTTIKIKLERLLTLSKKSKDYSVEFLNGDKISVASNFSKRRGGYVEFDIDGKEKAYLGDKENTISILD